MALDLHVIALEISEKKSYLLVSQRQYTRSHKVQIRERPHGGWTLPYNLIRDFEGETYLH